MLPQGTFWYLALLGTSPWGEYLQGACALRLECGSRADPGWILGSETLIELGELGLTISMPRASVSSDAVCEISRDFVSTGCEVVAKSLLLLLLCFVAPRGHGTQTGRLTSKALREVPAASPSLPFTALGCCGRKYTGPRQPGVVLCDPATRERAP